MPDIKMVKGNHRSVMYAQSEVARLNFHLDFNDTTKTPDGDIYIIRSNEAAEDLKKEYERKGMSFELGRA